MPPETIPTEVLQLRIIRNEADSIRRAIEAPVEVSNIDFVKKYLREELRTFLTDLERSLSKIKLPDLPEIKLRESVRLTNLKELGDTLTGISSLLNSIKNETLNLKVHIPEIKVPDIAVPPINVPQSIVNVEPEVEIDFKPIINALKPLKFLTNKKSTPLSVRLSDGQEWVQLLKKAADDLNEGAGRMIHAFASGGGMTVDEYKSVSGTPKTGGHKRVTVTTSGTPVQVSTTSVSCTEVYLSGDTDSGAVMVVGFNNTVDATVNNKNGMIIIPGNVPLPVKTNDLTNLWVDSETNGGVLCVGYVSLSS